MSIDDDSFNIEDALKGTPEEEAFDRFMTWAYANQQKVIKLQEENQILRDAIRIVQAKT